MGRKIFSYSHYQVAETTNLFRVTDLDYDADFSIGLNRTPIEELSEELSEEFGLEPQLIAIIVASIMIARDNSSLSKDLKWKRLPLENILEGLKGILKMSNGFSVDELITAFSEGKPQAVEDALLDSKPDSVQMLLGSI